MRSKKPRRLKAVRIPLGTHWQIRSGDITASTVGALFGFHPRETIYGLANRVTGAPVPEVRDNAMIQRGLDLEETVARMYQRRHPDQKISRNRFYLRDPSRGFGCTPDYLITTSDRRKGVLECKTVAPQIFRKYWTETTAPMWIALQCLAQMMFTRAQFGVIACLEADGWRWNLHEYLVPFHEDAATRVLEAVDAFRADLAAGRIPQPDYSRDGALIAMANPQSTPGKEIDLRHDNRMPELLAERERVRAQIKAAKEQEEKLEAEIMDKVGDAELALVAGWRVTLKNVHIKEHTRKASDYRQLRATREEGFGPEA